MKLEQVEQGIGRLHDDDGRLSIELLDTPFADIDDLLAAGSLMQVADASPATRLNFDEVRFLPVVQRPSNIVIAGLNYRAHCEEIGVDIPDKLVFAPSLPQAMHAAGESVIIPTEASEQVDYEGEIAVVIGAPASKISADQAWSVIAGLAPLNDVSARDVQAQGGLEAVAQAKGFPTFKPIGPCLATLDEFADPGDIGVSTHVNGELRQDGRSGDMVFPIPNIVALVSARIDLRPGDVICTGTPGGVAHGGMHPYLQPGDEVTVTVEGLPPLTNRFAGG